jgi:hypothetical protein
MTIDQCVSLSETWYEGRLEPGYERPPLDHYQGLLRSVGLVGEAWALTPPLKR